MKIRFLGVGSAFTLPADGDWDLNNCDWQSNILVTSDTGKNLLIDCGSDIRFALFQLKIKPPQYTEFLDSIYISHLHADHIGGMEPAAFCTYFTGKPKRLKLFCNRKLMGEMWRYGLKAGLESIQGKVVTLTEYFDCNPIEKDGHFDWEGIKFTPVQTVHVMAGYTIKYSYGLLIRKENDLNEVKNIFITTDTQFCPSQILDFYKAADIIYQDCETAPFKSGVHAHYEDLKTLKPEIKAKMWLYHYQPNPKQDAKADGFAGFVKKQQEFEI